MLRIIKVVIYHLSDLEWAVGHAEKIKGDCEFFVQPEWSKMDELMPEILAFIKQNPRWNLSLQTHKYIDIP